MPGKACVSLAPRAGVAGCGHKGASVSKPRARDLGKRRPLNRERLGPSMAYKLDPGLY